jgi:N6-L-threonylcarbamoyladenine synthase
MPGLPSKDMCERGTNPSLKILGIETSCDETSAALVEDGTKILSNIVATQYEFHQDYAGVVPEIASRRHHEVINYVVDEALKRAGASFSDVDAVAVTAYPGLIGSLLIGVLVAKTISFSLRVPLIGVDHIEAHLYSVQFNNNVTYPILGIIVSGGHTLAVLSREIGHYEILGSTLDDAVGEAFDKVSKHLNLGYPGGPAIEKAAKGGSEKAFDFPRALLERREDRYNFSYSGLKNAVINQLKRFLQEGFQETVENIAASFQAAATDVLITKARWMSNDLGIDRVALAGGVSNNTRLRELFANEPSFVTYLPERTLTQDNGAMIAGLAYHRYRQGHVSGLDLEPQSKLVGIVKGKRMKHGN